MFFVELFPGARLPGALEAFVEPDLVVPVVLEVFVVFVFYGFIFVVFRLVINIYVAEVISILELT